MLRLSGLALVLIVTPAMAQEKDRLVTLTSQEANNFLQVTGALDQCVGAALTRSDIAPCRALAVFLGAFVDRIKNAPEAPEKK